MTNATFDKISRPERDALEFIQRQMGELALVKTRVVNIMATQMAGDIRSATESGVDYGTALDQAKHRWGVILG